MSATPDPKQAAAEVDCVSPDRSPAELLALRGRVAEEAEALRAAAEHFSLLSSETRVRILRLLAVTGELCVCDLATILEMTPAAISQHLSRLRAGRLVTSRRAGMTIYYRRSETEACPAPSAARLLSIRQGGS